MEKKEAPVPFMLGSNSHEFPGVTWTERRTDLRYFVEDHTHDVLARAYGGPEVLEDHLMSDYLFTQQARALARGISRMFCVAQRIKRFYAMDMILFPLMALAIT